MMANTQRLKLLRAVERKPHRYQRLRWLTMGLSLAVLFALPLLGVARLDLWSGRHIAWGRPTDFIFGAAMLFFAMVGFYVITFLINALYGRLFCGWGCPIGEMSRLSEQPRVARGGRARVQAYLRSAGFALVLAAATLLWWIDPHVFVAGTTSAKLAAAGALVGLAALLMLQGRYWSWRFCQQVCPIGLYYSAVQTRHGFGIHFDRAPCTDCNACVNICPVDLDPRDLEAPRDQIGGLALDGMPGSHHCLSCGDCVRACELVLQNQSSLVALRLGAKR